MRVYDCKNDLSALILKILMWWKVCRNLCGMQINSNCPSSSGIIQEWWFQINSNTPWVLELKDMSDIWVIWNSVTLTLNHLRLPQCCITSSSMDYTIIKFRLLWSEIQSIQPSYVPEEKAAGFFAKRPATHIDFAILDCKFLAVTGHH